LCTKSDVVGGIVHVLLVQLYLSLVQLYCYYM
jgi:hypothetical protein